MIGSMPSRDRFRCHFAPSEFEPATVVPDKDLDKYDEYLPESLLAWEIMSASRDEQRQDSDFLHFHLKLTPKI
ncbi:TPA: hypothetical protein ACH7T8_003841 [Escherichia coli]|nr:hypothetical protein [Escherichia coli]